MYEEYAKKLRDAASAVDRTSRGYDMQRRIINSGSELLGLRTPQVKFLAKSVPKAERKAVADGFFDSDYRTYEDILFAGCVIAQKGDYSFTRDYLKRVIPLFDSWAHTDTVVPLLRWTDVDVFLRDFDYLTECDGQYEVRTYIIYMMTRCLTDERIDFALDRLLKIKFGDYYVDMGAAWLLCDALIKQYDKTIPLIESGRFPTFVHNKAIQKARESFRVSTEKKAYLNSLKKA